MMLKSYQWIQYEVLAMVAAPTLEEARMNPTRRNLIGGAGALLTGTAAAGEAGSTTMATLLRRSEQGNAALMRGDVPAWSAQIPLSPDFVLRSPFGGAPTRTVTADTLAAMGRFFRDGTLEQDVVTTISTPDLIVLAVVERAHVAVGGLPAQPWALRVTLVYRREAGEWRLVLRHADPLPGGITLQEAAAFGRRPAVADNV
jgi:hypothetical protein